MEAFDSICLLTGIASVGIGIYEFITKQLVGRGVVKATREQILRFLPYDAATYLLTGILLALLGLGGRIEFFAKTPVIIAIVILSIVIIGFNIRFANQILGRQK